MKNGHNVPSFLKDRKSIKHSTQIKNIKFFTNVQKESSENEVNNTSAEEKKKKLIKSSTQDVSKLEILSEGEEFEGSPN